MSHSTCPLLFAAWHCYLQICDHSVKGWMPPLNYLYHPCFPLICPEVFRALVWLMVPNFTVGKEGHRIWARPVGGVQRGSTPGLHRCQSTGLCTGPRGVVWAVALHASSSMQGGRGPKPHAWGWVEVVEGPNLLIPAYRTRQRWHGVLEPDPGKWGWTGEV